LEDLKAYPVDQKLRSYKSDLLRHVTRMDSSRMAKIVLNCRPNGRRRLGRPSKRLLDEVETGLSRPDWWRMMTMITIMTTTTTNFTLSYLSFSIIKVHILKLSSPSKFRVKYTKKILLGLLTLENETERLP